MNERSNAPDPGVIKSCFHDIKKLLDDNKSIMDEAKERCEPNNDEIKVLKSTLVDNGVPREVVSATVKKIRRDAASAEDADKLEPDNRSMLAYVLEELGLFIEPGAD